MAASRTADGRLFPRPCRSDRKSEVAKSGATGGWHTSSVDELAERRRRHEFMSARSRRLSARLALIHQNVLKSQGMDVQALHTCTLFTGLIMSKIASALPAFAGQVTADDRNRIGALSRKALRRGVTHTAIDIEEIIDSADRKLFTRITQPGQWSLFISSSSFQNLCILPL